MVKLLFPLLLIIALGCTPKNGKKAALADAKPGPITLVIHGGAGTILRQNLTPEKEAAYRERLTAALDTGYAVLERGGKSTDAVIAAIRIMEDSPLSPAKGPSSPAKA